MDTALSFEGRRYYKLTLARRRPLKLAVLRDQERLALSVMPGEA